MLPQTSIAASVVVFCRSASVPAQFGTAFGSNDRFFGKSTMVWSASAGWSCVPPLSEVRMSRIRVAGFFFFLSSFDGLMLAVIVCSACFRRFVLSPPR